MVTRQFDRFAREADPTLAPSIDVSSAIRFKNSTGKEFLVSEDELIAVVRHWGAQQSAIDAILGGGSIGPSGIAYDESAFRDIFSTQFSGDDFRLVRTLAESQTRSLATTLSIYVGFLIGRADCANLDSLSLDAASIQGAIDALA